METSRFAAIKKYYNQPDMELPPCTMFDFDIKHYSYNNLVMDSKNPEVDKIVSEMLCECLLDDQDGCHTSVSSDEGINVDSSTATNTDDDSAVDDNNNDDDDVEEPKITNTIISPTIRFFSVENGMKKSGKFIKSIQKLLDASCNSSKNSERFCVITFYNESGNVYKFLTRQVRTAKGVLTQHNDVIFCGWSGMTSNIRRILCLPT